MSIYVCCNQWDMLFFIVSGASFSYPYNNNKHPVVIELLLARQHCGYCWHALFLNRSHRTHFLLFRYNLLFYINPQFYGYSAITKVLLLNNRLKCEYESTLNCISTDGNAVLSRFGLDSVNPYEHLVVSDSRRSSTHIYNDKKLYRGTSLN